MTYVPVGPSEGEGALPTRKTQTITLDEQGDIWVGLYNAAGKVSGVYHYESGKNAYTAYSSLWTVSTLLAVDNHVLAGTRRNGLQVMDRDTGQWQRIELDGVNTDRIWQIIRDSHGNIWLATQDAGLLRFDLRSLTLESMASKLPEAGPRIAGLVEDSSGLLWLATPNGIIRFDPVAEKSDLLSNQLGLRLTGYNHNMLTQMGNGDILMGSYTGTVQFSPAAIADMLNEPQQQYPLLLSDFRLFNTPQDLAIGTGIDGKAKHINYTDRLSLSYKDAWFSLAFSSSNFNDLSAVRYAWQMAGFNDQWVETDATNRIASFTGLQPGEYTLKIKASHADGSWPDAYRSLAVNIAPPWWQTWQAYVSYVVLAIVILTLGYRLRVRALVSRAQELEQKVEQRTETINQLMAQKERMFANISHEFKTPLTLILNPLESLLGGEKQQEKAQKLGMMKRNGQRLLRMVDQLLQLSHLETVQDDEVKHYSLKEALERLLTSFEPLFESRALTLSRPTFDDVVLSMKGDALEIILTNLISNAVKYTPEKGHIAIAVKPSGKRVTIEVSDTGIGIDEDNQKLVFNRFTRANDKHESIPGAGIGLALVKELVDSHDGTITLRSVVNQGSTFSVQLPVYEVDPAKVTTLHGPGQAAALDIESMMDSVPEVAGIQVEIADDDASRPVILLIDDNADMLSLLTDTLSGRFQCLTASDGEQGIAMAKEYLPDLVISDVMMPGISGYEVVKVLKEVEATSHIPVILLTAKGDVQSRIEGWRHSADEYLAKPFNGEELHMRIDNLLSIRKLLRARFQRDFVAPQVDKPNGKTISFEPEVRDREPELADAHQRFIDRINAILEKHYSDESLDVAQLADNLAMSPRNLNRKMRSILDLTANETIRGFRLKKAAELLHQGGAPSAVAFEVGFSSHSYFSKCFKAQFSCLPSEYVVFRAGSGEETNH